MPVLSVSDFRKSYGRFTAVDGISFAVERGEIFGLLGPNGAGKTTTLECLEGIRQPDGGQLRVQDVDPSREPGRLPRLIGVQLQTSSLPPSLTVSEALRLFAAYHRSVPPPDLLERLGLAEHARQQYSSLSVGLQRRLALALAVAHQPPIVILDEPTAGLDVASRASLHELMAELRAQGTTILLATHDMAEAEKMADRVAILLRGRIAAEGTPRELTATGSGLTKISLRSENGALQNDPRPFPAVRQQLSKDDYMVYYSADPGPTVAALIAAVNECGDRLVDLRVERPSLEERFLEITTPGGAQ